MDRARLGIAPTSLGLLGLLWLGGAGCRAPRPRFQVVEATRPRSAPDAGAPAAPAAGNSVFERLTFYGDLRLRHESDFALDDQPDRSRERLRLRLGVNYPLSDEVLVGGRLVTGDPGDPNSPHVTLGNEFDGFDLTLDRVFLRYTPAFLEGAFLTAGKFDHAFTRNPVYGELVWDADVQPEGAVLGRTFGPWGPFESWRLTVGGYSILEQAAADEVQMWVSELAGRMRLGPQTSSNVAASYYGYSDLTPSGSQSVLGENAGNATVDTDGDGTPDEFVSDFGILNALAGVTYEGWAQPLTVSAEYIENLQARIDRDSGWAAGVSIGRAARAGDWRFYYQWQIVEQDAVFSGFAQDDFLFATNHRSHVLGVNYQFTDDIGLNLWSLVSARDVTSSGPTSDSSDDAWRVRLDLNVKF